MNLDILISRICHVITAAIIAWALMVTLGHASCADQSEEIDAKCWPTLQAAADAALARDLPLMLPRGDYAGPLVIDYTQHASTGFELISRRATIYGGMTVTCQADCFYFHQEGTLFISGQSDGYLLTVGKPDFSDPQNSIKFDHVIVNNGGRGGAVQLNYVLGAEMFIVADTTGALPGIDIRQLQFSVLKGAQSSAGGAAMAIEDGYVIANTFESLDQEASPLCESRTSQHISGNTWTSVYLNCQSGGIYSSSEIGNTATTYVEGAAMVRGWSADH
jgi:hypothetical protein